MSDRRREIGDEELARITRIIAASRRVLRVVWLLTGIALAAGLFLATLSAAVLVDLIAPMTMPFRLAALFIIAVPTMLALFAGVVRPALRRLSNNHMGRRIERLLPAMQSRLVTTLDIAQDGNYRAPSLAFRQRLISETLERVSGFQPASIADRAYLRRSGVFAGAALLMFVAIVLAFSQRVPTALARLFLPFADIPPATGIYFTAEPGDAKLLRGDDVTISGIVHRGTTSNLALEFRQPSGDWTTLAMQPTTADRFETTLETLDRSIEYRLVGGRTWTKRNRIEVIDRPSIASLSTVVRYPDYMKIPEPVTGQENVADATGPVGSRVEVVVDVAGDAASGEIQMLAPVIESRPVATRTERVWFEHKLPEGARAEGTWLWDHSLKFRAAHTEPPGAGFHSHGFQGAPIGFDIGPDDLIYAYMFIVPGQTPEQIMLQFHDGKDMEHRAYWGADKIQLGVANTVSRARVGDVPPQNEWVRLEIPAKSVGMAGKSMHGVLFTLFGGQCKWNRIGTVDPESIPIRSFMVQDRYEMTRVGAETSSEAASTPTSRWSGTFTLAQDGFYRVHLENELGYPNKRMQEGKLTALPDNPPQIALERPGADITLSEPQSVPLFLRAFDDFGLSDIALSVQKGDSGGFVGWPVKTYDEVVRADAMAAALDLKPHQLKAGEWLRYRLQARDRKGQLAQTKEFVVRIQQDNNAADKQLASLEQQQDTLEQHLDQLIKQQAKITEALEAEPAELRQELAKLTGPQDENVKLANQVQSELHQAANQMANSKLVAPQIAAQLRATEQAFQHRALQPMRELLDSLRNGADPQKPAPASTAIANSAQQVQRELESIRARFGAIDRAQQNMKGDPSEALAQLGQDLMAQNAQLTAQELEQLRDMLDRLAGQLNMLEGRENELARQTGQALPAVLPEIDKEQSKIESAADKLFAQTEKVLDAERSLGKTRHAPDSQEMDSSADAANAQDTAPVGRPAKKSGAPLSNEMKGAESGAAANGAAQDGKEDARAVPAGVKPKSVSGAKKSRNNAKSDMRDHATATGSEPSASSRNQPAQDAAQALRAQLAKRQEQTAEQLREAQEDLQLPRERLEQLLRQLRDALESDDAEAAEKLARVMRSLDMQQADQLARALRDTPERSEQAAQPASAASLANLNAAMSAALAEFQSNDIDLIAQAVLLRMQPRVREELLQGMREEGPEAYRKFIQDYFDRLTKIKSPP
jgi:hypothetical protein